MCAKNCKITFKFVKVIQAKNIGPFSGQGVLCNLKLYMITTAIL